MEEPLENLYFNWLYTKVSNVRNQTPSTKFDRLLIQLHRTEFVWLLSGDDNRAEDGRELRNEFLTQSRLPNERAWYEQPCSVLEMLIAFSNRAAFETGMTTKQWFWIMLENLGLSDFNDASNFNHGELNEILDVFIWRTYSPDGRGGLFPLMSTPRQDQRKVEIWYQFSEYVYERDLV